MLKGITWGHYLTIVIVIIVIWYAVVAVLYYRKEIKDVLKGKYKFPARPGKAVVLPDEEEEAYIDPRSSFDELEEIVTDIKTSILEAAGKQASKNELLGQLKTRLAFYGGLRQPAFRMAINNFLIQNSENICGVVFSEQELDEAWETLPR
jgi:hypothetical protein